MTMFLSFCEPGKHGFVSAGDSFEIEFTILLLYHLRRRLVKTFFAFRASKRPKTAKETVRNGQRMNQTV